jgi:Uma2 family endonuclease
MRTEPTRRLFTVAEYYRLGEVGILREEERVELVEGDIMELPHPSPADAWCVTRLSHFFLPRVADDGIVMIRSPIRLDELSEPVPDLSLIRPRPFSGPHPVAAEVLLIIEVSDGGLRYDLGTKIPLYGQHGVPEIWVVDLQGDIIHRYRQPTATGYEIVEQKRRGERISPEAFPSLELSIDEILGPKA